MHVLIHAVTLSSFFISCSLTGYSIRPAQLELPHKIKTVTVPVFENDTHQERLGALASDSLRRVLQIRGNVRIVKNEDEPDGYFVGRILEASFDPANTNTPPQAGGLPANEPLVNQFTAGLKIQLSLIQKGTRKVLWTKTLSRADTVPASTVQLESQGAAMNPVINDSRARIRFRAIADRWAEDAFNDLVTNF